MKKRRRQRLLLVAGARPNFMKVAPLLRALRRRPESFEPLLVHTGQHYDEAMSDVFFDELGIPPPDRHLGVGSGSHAVQTARIMEAFEPVVIETKPQRVVVVGDVNSTAACALVASKMAPPIPVAHVEAGLRSFDLEMPEEINRLVTDALSDLLFTTSPDADVNLRREGVPRRRIHRVGNLMIDTLKAFAARADASKVLDRLGLTPPYALLTLHRPSNVDDETTLRRILAALQEIGRSMPVIFPAHPRTADRLRRLAMSDAPRREMPGAASAPGQGAHEEAPGPGAPEGAPGLRLVEPLGYLDFLHLQKHASLVLTDSGGVQEETTILGVPCLTLRENTERPITLTRGTNRLVGTDTRRIVLEARRALKSRRRRPPSIPLWDGRAADRIAAVLARAPGRPGLDA